MKGTHTLGVIWLLMALGYLYCCIRWYP